MRQQMSTLLQRQASGQQMRPQAMQRLQNFAQTSPQNQARVQQNAFGQPPIPQPRPLGPMQYQGQQMQAQPMGGFQQQPGHYQPQQGNLSRGQLADMAFDSMGQQRPQQQAFPNYGRQGVY